MDEQVAQLFQNALEQDRLIDRKKEISKHAGLFAATILRDASGVEGEIQPHQRENIISNAITLAKELVEVLEYI